MLIIKQKEIPVIINDKLTLQTLIPEAFNAVSSLFFCKDINVIIVDISIVIGSAILINHGIVKK